MHIALIIKSKINAAKKKEDHVNKKNKKHRQQYNLAFHHILKVLEVCGYIKMKSIIFQLLYNSMTLECSVL